MFDKVLIFFFHTFRLLLLSLNVFLCIEVPLAGAYITEAPAGLNAFLYPLHYLFFLGLSSVWVLKQFPLFSYFFLFPLPPECGSALQLADGRGCYPSLP